MISPAIQFNGNCAEALEFYERVFHATDKHVQYYHDAPDGSDFSKTEETKNYVMHSGLTICGTHINMCDTMETVTPGSMFKFNVFMNSEDQVYRAFHMLKEDGKVIVELGPQFFSPMYASVVDRFGLRWQLMVGES